MCEALNKCYEIVNKWVNSHPSSFPPVVINVTDGEATDGDPVPNSERIRTLGTYDGNTLLFNIHISPSSPISCTFSLNQELLTDDFAKRLFRMSSRLPPNLIQEMIIDGYQIDNNARGFAFNADLFALLRSLDIDTRSARQFIES